MEGIPIFNTPPSHRQHIRGLVHQMSLIQWIDPQRALSLTRVTPLMLCPIAMPTAWDDKGRVSNAECNKVGHPRIAPDHGP